jgi:hypothetical protein
MQSLNRIRPLTEDVERARLVKVLIMRDVAPRHVDILQEIEKNEVKRANLNESEWQFYDNWYMQKDDERKKLLQHGPSGYNVFSLFKNFSNLEELHLRTSLSDTRPAHKVPTPDWELLRVPANKLRTPTSDLNLSHRRAFREAWNVEGKHYSERLEKNFASGEFCIPPYERTSNEYCFAQRWAQKTVIIFKKLLSELRDVYFTRITINTPATAGLYSWLRIQTGVNVTTLEIAYEGIDEHAARTNWNLRADRDFLSATQLHGLKHLHLSGTSLLGKGALDLTNLNIARLEFARLGWH